MPSINLWNDIFPAEVASGFTSPALRGDVESDMPEVLSAIGRKASLAHMKQVHGPEVKVIDSPGVYTCDAIFTSEPDMALVVRTADCLPLALYSEKEGVAGVVHMGWRSAVGGILENIPFDLSSFTCVAGPGLRLCCYRVGEEFLENGRTGAFIEKRNRWCYFDAVAFARRNLMDKGLKEARFFDCGACSYCSDGAFHSHRRSGTLDRTMTFIVRGARPWA